MINKKNTQLKQKLFNKKNIRKNNNRDIILSWL